MVHLELMQEIIPISEKLSKNAIGKIIINNDPNKGAFVYDNQTAVLANQENHSSAPGNNIWHLEFYVKPDEDLKLTTIIYYKANDLITYPKLTTLQDTQLILDCDIWSYTKEDFELFDREHDSNAHDGRMMRELNYNSNYDSKIYGINNWYSIRPNTTDDTDSEQDYLMPYDISPYDFPEWHNDSIFLLFNQTGKHSSNRMIFTINKKEISEGGKLSQFNTGTGILGNWRYYDVLNDSYETGKSLIGVNIPDFNMDEVMNMSGIPIGTVASAYFECDGDPHSNTGSKTDVAEVSRYPGNNSNTVDIYVTDTFGTNIRFKIYLDEGGNWCFNWSITDMSKQ